MFEIREEFVNKVKGFKDVNVHVIMIATKPDIIKQYPFYKELKSRDKDVLLIHTGQHYDYNLSGGMLEEFGLEVDINLSIEGAYHQKVAQIITRLGDIFVLMKGLGKIPVPYIHGDTMTSMAAGCAAWSNAIACVHVEAGIRTLGLKKQIYLDYVNGIIGFDEYYSMHLDRNNYEGGQFEPYPEQYNTRCSEPASGIYLVQADVVRDNLINEGFRKDRIFVVGNSVADSLLEAKTRESDIFTKFPMLKEGFVRFCIHRRENCLDKQRFMNIFEAIERTVDSGKVVLLISLYATEKAMDDFGLRMRLNALKTKANFIYSEAWPYYGDVISAMTKCRVCATDSGSMQEEMNILGVPTVTLRYGTDRPESCLAGGNVIAPLSSGKIIYDTIEGAWNSKQMQQVANIYGSEVAKKSIDIVLTELNKGNLFEYYSL